MASDDDYEMNSSGEEFNDRPPTEEDLIDSLFLTCDVEKVGRVPVCRLIEYLKITTSAISENDEDLRNLGRIFSYGSDEAEIDIITYRKGMNSWIDSIRNRNGNQADHDVVLEPTSKDSNCLSKEISILRGMDSSIVGTFGTEMDPVDQQNMIADLQHQNRKLTEENSKLRQQIDIQEDTVNVNNAEINTLQKKIKSLQQIADSRQELIAENEELKTQVSKLQEQRKEHTCKINHLDKEKLHYENRCSDFELKIIELTSQLECIHSQKDVLTKELAECKHELSHAKELKNIQEIHLNERYKEVTSLQKQVSEICEELKECKKEKDEMQVEFVQSQHASQHFNGTGDAPLEMVPKVASSFVCSTPMRHSQSLCMELKGMIGNDKCLPSPLCPKEFHKEYRTNLLSAFDEEDEEYIGEKDDYQLEVEISSFTEKFKHKQSELLAEIDSYFQHEESEDKRLCKEKLQTSLQKELTEMTEQMASLAIAKDTVDKRVNHLNSSMKKIREENAMLRRMQHDSRSMLVECDRDLQSVVDRRLLILKDKLDEEKNIVKNLKRELDEKTVALSKFGGMHFEERVKKFEDQIHALQKENMELYEKQNKAEGQMSCLQDDMRKSEKDVEIEKHRTFELEENLYSNKLARQMDLKEIWRIVQKDIENECSDDKIIDNGFTDSTDTIKERIFNEILALKAQLDIKEQKETMNKARKKELLLHHCSCFGSNSNASSPLVEALTIDFFNGNRQVPHLFTSPNKEITVHATTTQTYNTGYTDSRQNNINGNVDITKTNKGLVSLEDSFNRLRRLSYQEAMDNHGHEIRHDVSLSPTYISDNEEVFISDTKGCHNNFTDVQSGKTGNPCQQKLSEDQHFSSENQVGFKVDEKTSVVTMKKGKEDYCWNDNFDDDISYSSYSFSHLSYPFQPKRQDVVRVESSQNDEGNEWTKSEESGDGNILAEEERKVDAEITQMVLCPLTQGNNESNTSVSLTSSLANNFEKLTLDDSLEEKVDAAILHLNEENKMDLTDLRSTNPQLSKIRQNNLARRREQMKQIAIMPDLKESRESMVSTEDPFQEEESTKAPSENGEVSQDKEKVVFPSIPDLFLKKHGLAYKKKEDITLSIHQLTETEVENKFTSLSLAFKTDKLTLEKRLEIQERYRDLSEQNVEKEIKSLRGALETLSHLPECVDSQVQDVLKKIRRHIDVLEQASTKVSSRAEVFGAVQQEKRMSKAIEVMIAHVDNLKMSYEREHSELEEARKLIQDGRPFGGNFDSDSGFPSRRSASVCQGMGLGQKTSRRRVSESLGPRVGSNGTLSHSFSLDYSYPMNNKVGLRKDTREDEDAKSKFQSAVASTVMKNTVTNTLRSNSTDRLSISSREPSLDGGEKTITKQNSKEEEAFQKGFEQGYKAQVGRDLSQLREQQNTVSESLEHIMDECDQNNEQEEKNLTETIKDKFWETIPSWDSASKRLRMTMAGFVFFMALCSIVLSFFPVGQAAIQVQPQYRHMGQPPS